MPYEVEAVPVTNTSTQPTPPMREERVVETRRQRSAPQTSQSDISVTTKGSPEAPRDKTAEPVTLSPAAAALARKEQKFRQEQASLKAQIEALEKDRSELTQLRELKAKLDAKDFSAIKDHVPYDEYTNYLIEQSAGTSEEQQEIRQLKADIEGIKTSQKSEAEKREAVAVQERKNAVSQLVETNEAFTTIKELKMQDAVVQYILDTWKEDQVELTPEEAAKEVEELLVERATKWASVSKLKPVTPPEEPKKQLPPVRTPPVKTLTQDMAGIGEVKAPKRSFAGMTDSQRYAEARRRAEQKLKGS